MATQRFQPGDKVRPMPSSAGVLGLPRYRTQTVAHVDDFGKVSLQGASTYFHPSHFELVRRAVDSDIVGRYGHDADMPCYSLKDGEGDWWVYETEDPRAVGAWHLVAEPHVTREGTDEGVDSIANRWGIDDTSTDPAETYSLKDEDGDWHTAPAPEGPFVLLSGFMERTLDEVEDTFGIDAGKPALAALMAEPPVWAEGEEPAPLKEGDRVQIVSTSATDPSHGIADGMRGVGDEFTVTEVGTNDHGPYAKGDEGYWWHPGDLERVTEPAPLKEGDAVLVWARVVNPKPDSDGDLTLATPTGDGYDDTFYVRPDAIVRPADGQVPPWVEEPEREEVEAIAAALQREGGMPAGAALQMAESLHRAGVRAEVTDR